LTGITEEPRGAIASSFGAAALLRCVRSLDGLKAMVLRAPVSNYSEVRRLQFGDDGIAKWREAGVLMVNSSKGPLESGYEFYRDAIAHDTYAEVANLKVPTLVIQGSKDEDIPLQHSERLVRALGENARLQIVDGANHSFGTDDNFRALFDAAGSFLVQHLSGKQ